MLGVVDCVGSLGLGSVVAVGYPLAADDDVGGLTASEWEHAKWQRARLLAARFES